MADKDELLKELRQIRRLLISSLIVWGVDTPTIAEVLDYKQASSITNEIPVSKLKKAVPTVRLLTDMQPKGSDKKRQRAD